MLWLLRIFCISLPWQGLKAATKKQKYEKISEKKMSTPIEVICRRHSFFFDLLLYVAYLNVLMQMTKFIIGIVQAFPIRICFIFSLLSLIALRWQARLWLCKENLARPFYSWRYGHLNIVQFFKTEMVSVFESGFYSHCNFQRVLDASSFTIELKFIRYTCVDLQVVMYGSSTSANYVLARLRLYTHAQAMVRMFVL